MKAKTKIVALAMAAVLLVGASVVGTMAYLTSTDKVTNTFTVGNVAILLDEAKTDEYGVPNENADRVKANTYKLMPGHEYTKDPTVTVEKGSEESYIRMLVTINKKADLDAIGFDMTDVFENYNSNKWTFKGQTKEDDSMVYEFRYYEKVAAPNDDVELTPLFTSIIVPGELTGEQLATLDDLHINIVAQAIQADGFNTADAAWAALDTAD